jgi:hypothetical protein
MTGYDNLARPAGLSAQGALGRVGEPIWPTHLQIINHDHFQSSGWELLYLGLLVCHICLCSKGSETLDMASVGLEEMFECYLADTCSEICSFMRMGDKRTVLRAQAVSQDLHRRERKLEKTSQQNLYWGLAGARCCTKYKQLTCVHMLKYCSA